MTVNNKKLNDNKTEDALFVFKSYRMQVMKESNGCYGQD
jgi:hypothetical protein